MVEVERDWEDRLKKVRESAKDHAEWRINALQQAYQARDKRRRQAKAAAEEEDEEEEEEEEEEDLSETVSRLEAQLAERDKRIQHLEARLRESVFLSFD